MVSSGAALGGEQSGHILAASHGLCGDGVLTALQLATLCHDQGISLSDWLDRSFQAFPQAERDGPRSKPPRVDQVLSFGGALRTAEDAMGESGRVLVRASGTEPVLRDGGSRRAR